MPRLAQECFPACMLPNARCDLINCTDMDQEPGHWRVRDPGGDGAAAIAGLCLERGGLSGSVTVQHLPRTCMVCTRGVHVIWSAPGHARPCAVAPCCKPLTSFCIALLKMGTRHGLRHDTPQLVQGRGDGGRSRASSEAPVSVKPASGKGKGKLSMW